MGEWENGRMGKWENALRTRTQNYQTTKLSNDQTTSVVLADFAYTGSTRWSNYHNIPFVELTPHE